MNAIEIKGLTKRYGDLVALDHLELDVKKGELFALLGMNGAGKTTTIKLLSCLAAPTEGDATLCGHSIRLEPQRIKEIINISPQETAVASKLTVRENLTFVAEVYGCETKKVAERVENILADLKLTEVADRRAGTLSGGWQRRVSIAMALITSPEVLFLDEPTLGLDVLARHELWSFIRALKGRMTVILTTHYLEEAEALCDRVAMLGRGKLIAVGTVEEIKRRANTASFDEAFIRLSGEVSQ